MEKAGTPFSVAVGMLEIGVGENWLEAH